MWVHFWITHYNVIHSTSSGYFLMFPHCLILWKLIPQAFILVKFLHLFPGHWISWVVYVKFHRLATRKMIYRNIWGPFLVWADKYSRYHKWDLIFGIGWLHEPITKINFWYELVTWADTKIGIRRAGPRIHAASIKKFQATDVVQSVD
jgi:hypothetical protein